MYIVTSARNQFVVHVEARDVVSIAIAHLSLCQARALELEVRKQRPLLFCQGLSEGG